MACGSEMHIGECEGPWPKAAESQALDIVVEAGSSSRREEQRPSGKGVVRRRSVSVDGCGGGSVNVWMG